MSKQQSSQTPACVCAVDTEKADVTVRIIVQLLVYYIIFKDPT